MCLYLSALCSNMMVASIVLKVTRIIVCVTTLVCCRQKRVSGLNASASV